MLMRTAVPWLGSAALLGSGGYAGYVLASAGRWAALLGLAAALGAVVVTWWLERQTPEATRGVDRLGAVVAVVVAILVGLFVGP